MAWGARSGLKLPIDNPQNFLGIWLNGLGSPFGIETIGMPNVAFALDLG